MRFLGIDPSVSNLGWGVIESENKLHIASGTLCTDPAESMCTRLGKLHNKVEDIIKTYNPDVVGLESVFLQKSMYTVFKLSYVRGVVMSIIGKNKLNFIEVAPTMVKKNITGSGKASKDSIKKMLHHVINIPKGIKIATFDEADALAISYSAVLEYDISNKIQHQEASLKK